MSDYSINEVCARAKLAAKGAGYSWGMAEEVARCVSWLVSRELPAPTVLMSLLDSIPLNETVKEFAPESVHSEKLSLNELHRFRSNRDWLCPIASGCFVSDLFSEIKEGEQLDFENVCCPLLLVPFIADVAVDSAMPVSMKMDGEILVTDGKSLQYTAEKLFLASRLSRVSCKLISDTFENSTDTVLACKSMNRVTVSKSVWERLDHYAHKTYAPATEASRLLGAGAGLNDND